MAKYYYDTPEGRIPFTPEQEAERDAEVAKWEEDSWQRSISDVKATAYGILQPTDWLVVRQVENGSTFPTDWNDWREFIRLESQTKIAAIDACETYDDLQAYLSSEAYAYWPPEPTTPKLA
jgi:hypothetical protein